MAEEKDSKTPAGEPAPKKGKRNKWLVPTVIVAVIVVLGVGFWAWHNTPGFCNSMCHKPMDKYVETLNADDPGMMASVHKQAGLGCLDCHEAKFNEQVTEVMSWSADTFEMDSNGHLVDEHVDRFASAENCLKSGCHNWNDVVNSTWGFAGNDAKYNPHSSHQDGSVQCSDCHKSHTTSELYCAKCHALNLPDGWEATHD